MYFHSKYLYALSWVLIYACSVFPLSPTMEPSLRFSFNFQHNAVWCAEIKPQSKTFRFNRMLLPFAISLFWLFISFTFHTHMLPSVWPIMCRNRIFQQILPSRRDQWTVKKNFGWNRLWDLSKVMRRINSVTRKKLKGEHSPAIEEKIQPLKTVIVVLAFFYGEWAHLNDNLPATHENNRFFPNFGLALRNGKPH